MEVYALLNKLVFFPPLYPEEDFRSIIYRYHIRTGNNSILSTNKELFDVASYYFPLFPKRLDRLLSRFKEYSYFEKILNEKIIINKHSNLPFFLPFLDEDRQDLLISNVRGDGTKYFSNLAGNKMRRDITEEQRYCKDCLIEDYKKYGECYLHRFHQLSLFKNCYKHYTPLISKCPNCDDLLGAFNTSFQIVEPKCRKGHLIRKDDDRILESEANRIRDIFNDLSNLNANELQNRRNIVVKYKMWLAKNGYINNYTGTIIQEKLKKDFIVFAKRFTDIINISVEYLQSDMVYQHMFKDKSFKQSIIINILMMKFLAGNVEAFFKYNFPYHIEVPFGYQLRKCINKICPNFGETSVKLVKRKVNIGEIFGVFKCDSCGIAYTIGERNQREYITNRGWLFEENLKKMREDRVSITFLADNLGVSEKIIVTSLKKLNIEKNRRIISIDTLKEEMLTSIKENPGITRSQLFNKCPTLYITLKNSERQWMEEILPISNSRNTSIINWKDRDSKFLRDIEKAIEGVYQRNPRRQIKAETILNELSRNTKYIILQNKEKLTLCWRKIEENVEPLDNYLIRTVPMVYTSMKRNKQKITFKSFVKYKKEYGECSEEVKEIIIKKILELNNID